MTYTIRGSTKAVFTLNENDTAKSVIQNIMILLSTKQGTIPMYREFGLPMKFIDKPAPVARTMIVAEITEAIDKFEPRVELVGITFDIDNVSGEMIPIVEVKILDE